MQRAGSFGRVRQTRKQFGNPIGPFSRSTPLCKQILMTEAPGRLCYARGVGQRSAEADGPFHRESYASDG